MDRREQYFQKWLGEVMADTEKSPMFTPPPDENKVGTESYYFWLGKDAEE